MMQLLIVIGMLFVSQAEEKVCDVNAVVGHCLGIGCFHNHGTASCHGTRCLCNPGSCSIDGSLCQLIPSPLRDGAVIKMHAAPALQKPSGWLSFTASNDERVQRWYHYLRIGYTGPAAMKLKLEAAGPDTYKMLNVYGHGYAQYWVSYKNADGEVRASYTHSEAMPVKFVKVGCNMYKLQNMYHGPYYGNYVDQHHSHWLTVKGTVENAAVVSVWKDGETVDECGTSAPTNLVEDMPKDGEPVDVKPGIVIFATLACMAGMFTFGAIVLRRRTHEKQLTEGLLDEEVSDGLQ